MWKKYTIIVGLIVIILAYLPVLFLPKDVLYNLTLEDHFYEGATATFFMFAAGAFLYNFIIIKKRSLIFLLFALVFFFAAGEEISWGQRIFNFATPTAFEENNAQDEFNIHNLNFIQHANNKSGDVSLIKQVLNFNRLFILFWVAYCLILPVLNKYWPWVRNLCLKLRIPVVSAWIGVLYLINEVVSKGLETSFGFTNLYDPKVYEIKEAMWAFLAILMAVYFFSFVKVPKLVPSSEMG
jgi:hypothetical protein